MTAKPAAGPAWECGCGRKNGARSSYCGACGKRRAEAPVVASSLAAGLCPYDGAELATDGSCRRGGGHPYGRVCPFVCPACRARLEWSGACFQCRGAPSGRREDWSFPGPRYDLADDEGKALGDGHHWVFIEAGPRPAISLEENREVLAIVQRILRRGLLGAPVPA